MIGTIVNTVAIVVGGAIGLLFRKNMPERITSIYFQAIGLFTLAIGISMAVKMDHILIIVGSLAIGALVGEWLNLEKGAEKMSGYLKSKFKIGNERFSEGLITSFLLFCVGAMTIVGTVNEGTGGSSDILLTKSLMDFFSSILLASAFGGGVIASAMPVFIFQALLTLLASFAGTFFTGVIVQGLVSTGGILLMGLGINILEIKKLRILNMLPALVIVVFLLWLFTREQLFSI